MMVSKGAFGKFGMDIDSNICKRFSAMYHGKRVSTASQVVIIVVAAITAVTKATAKPAKRAISLMAVMFQAPSTPWGEGEPCSNAKLVIAFRQRTNAFTRMPLNTRI